MDESLAISSELGMRPFDGAGAVQEGEFGGVVLSRVRLSHFWTPVRERELRTFNL